MITTIKHKFAIITLFLIIILGSVLRTYRLSEALGDWHSWRQADTASVAREYLKSNKIDLLHPRFHDLSSVPSGLDNPEGWRMVEFPLRDGLHALLAQSFPEISFLVWGRLLSIIFSAVTMMLLYFIVQPISGKLAGLCSALIYAILPFSIYYGRVILPEPLLAMLSLLSLYLGLQFLKTARWTTWFGFTIALALALLLKPTALTILIPLYLYWLLVAPHKIRNFFSLFFASVLALLPYILWRQYIAQYAAGIPASSWLFNSNGIRFRGAWFRWLFGERIAKMILGYWGLMLAGWSLIHLPENRQSFAIYGGLTLGSLLYLTIIATGNVQHDYYQIQILPTLAILTGVGFAQLVHQGRSLLAKLYRLSLATAILALACALSWYEIRGFFWVNNRAMVAAGQRLDSLAPAEAIVIAPYQGDTAFLYQTNRRGYPIGGDIDRKIAAGATYYVTTTRDQEFQELKSKYTLVEETDQFAIIKLAK